MRIPVAPRILREKLENVTVRAGHLVKTVVEALGEPAPIITWSFKGKLLEQGEHCKIDSDEPYKSFLTLTNTIRKKSGRYTITASNESGTDEATININILDKPSPPEGPLEVSDVHADRVKLSWNPPKDDGGLPIENYMIEKMDVDTGRWVPAGKVGKDGTTAVVKGLEQGKKYHFRVKAINDEGSSEPLETDHSTVAKNPYDVPGVPGQPSLKDYDKDFVELKWDMPLRDGGAPITGWIIEKKDKFAAEFTPCAEIQGSTPQGKVSGLTEGEKYEFRVRAVNKAGKGEPSEPTQPILVKHKNLKPRIDRTNLKTIIVKSGQSVFFDVNVRGEPPPTIEWFHGKSETSLSAGEVYSIINVDYNTKFTMLKATRKLTGKYRIKATNRNGTDEADVDITVLGKPSRCGGPLQVSDVKKDGCKLAWKPPEDDGGSPIECYEIEKMDEETGKWVPCGRSTEPNFEVKNLQPGKSYKFRVRAVNKEGDGEDLETEKATLAKDPYDPPSKIDKPEITDWDKDRVELKWDKPKDDGGAPVEKYIIEKRKKGAQKWHKAKEVPGTTTVTTVTELEEEEEYEFRVTPVNKAGLGEPSDPSRSVKCKPRRLAPKIDRTNLKNIVIRQGQGCKFDVDVRGEPAPNITWAHEDKPIASDEHFKIDIEEYHTLLVLTQAQRKMHTGKYTIIAKNEHGTDEATVEIRVVTKPNKPKGPLNVSDVHAEGCKLKWEKPEDDGGEPITQYVVEKMDTETGRWVPCSTTRDPEADIKGLIPGKEYKFRVKAVNPEGESEPLETDTSILAKNPFDEPGKPGKPKATDWDKHFVQLRWDAPAFDGGAPITSYIIEKKDKHSTKWQKAAETIGNACECRVNDLLEGMEYEFRVKAVNKAGPGEPSDPSDKVIAKPRNRK